MKLKTYYHLTKPGIIYGNLLNTLAAFLFASKWHFSFGLLTGTLVGTGLIIAAACVFNNYLDRGIDAKMNRTKKRALVTGDITVSSALTFGSGLGALGFLVLAVNTNLLTVLLGVLAIFTYVVLYGVAKRRSVHGTVVGSIAGALPPVAGYTAVTNQLDGGAWLIFLLLVFWQMPHFYAIAIYRLKDYKAAGLPVLPLKSGISAAKRQIVAYIFAFILTVMAFAVLGHAGISFLVIMTIAGVYWLYRASRGLTRQTNPKNDAKWARQLFGLSLLVILTLDLCLALAHHLP